MAQAGIHALVIGTGRLSASLFVIALLCAGLGYRALRVWMAFVAAQTIHFACVAWLAAASDAANLRDIGGWPVAISVGAGFYGLALCTAAAWAKDRGSALRVAGHVGAVLIGLAFVATYVPLLTASMLFVLPLAGLVGALAVYLLRASCRMPAGAS